MIVLGLCAALIVAFVNLRDKPVIQLIEGQLLDWRFLLRGPILADQSIELIFAGGNKPGTSGQSTVATGSIVQAIDLLDRQGVRVIAIDPNLLKMSAPGAPGSDPALNIELAKALNRSNAAVVPYVFTMGPANGGRTALPDAIQRTAYSVFRSRETASVKKPLEAGGFLAPNAEILVAGMPGHVIGSTGGTRSRQYAYPVVGYGGAFYPSAALQVFRLSVDMKLTGIVVAFGEGLNIGSLYLPTDSLMRLAVNYHGPAGTYRSHTLEELLDGTLPQDTFKDKLVLIGLEPTSPGASVATPFDPDLSEIEFLANVIDNLLHFNPLIRSQQIIVLDILLLALIGLFFALLAAANRISIVLTLAGLATALLLAANVEALVLLNLWLGLTFPLAAIILCTTVLVVTKRISARRKRAFEAAEEADAKQFMAPWTFDRVTRLPQSKSESVVVPEDGEVTLGPDNEITGFSSSGNDVVPVPEISHEVYPPEVGSTPDSASFVEPESIVELEPAPEPEPEPEPETVKAPGVFPPPGVVPLPVPPLKDEPGGQYVMQKSKKPASLIPVMEASPRKAKALLPPLSATGTIEKGAVNAFDVAVLYINMSGFKSLGKAFGPTRASQFLHALNRLIEKTVVKHAGFLETYGDDADEGVMALFGLPEAGRNDAVNALECGRELAVTLSEWGTRQILPEDNSVKFCISLGYGPVLVYAAGDAANPVVSAIGDAIYITSNLHKAPAAEGARVIASAKLVKEARDAGNSAELLAGFTEQKGQKVPGCAEATSLWCAGSASF
ncbi:MAG: adenylate/guanylate cyclase domain-containing protein [Sneathiella sp.]|nr:adenylate/guanylate cyclase domain-containing protein [Sneathiella sp.]